MKNPRGQSELTSSGCGDEEGLPGGPARPCTSCPQWTDMAREEGCMGWRLPGSAHASPKIGVILFVTSIWPTPKGTPEDFCSMRKQGGNQSNMSQEKSSPAMGNPPSHAAQSIPARTNAHSHTPQPPAARKPNLQKKHKLKFNLFG